MSSAGEEVEVENESMQHLAIIAEPLAKGKACRRLLRSIKKCIKAKVLKRGVKEVTKAIRKGEQGIVIIAGDISPIDVVTHLPVMCEEGGIPYIFVPHRNELGQAAGTKRPTCCVMLTPPKRDDPDTKKYYEKALKQLQ